MSTVLRLALCLLITLSCAWAGAAPEFGASISADRGDPLPKLANLRGKVVVVLLFFQSWCPVCNGWSPDLIKQMDEAYGRDPRVVLVAVKTDGDAAGGKSYLAEKGAGKGWLVVADEGGAYAGQVMGPKELWQYAIVDPEGNVADKGKAGQYFVKPGAKVFALAAEHAGKRFGAAAKPVLPAGKSYPASVSRAVTLAEAGCFAEAIVEARKAPKADAAELEADVLAQVASRVTAWSATVADAASPQRFPAYQQLRDVGLKLKGSEPAKAADKAIADANKDKAMRRELDAERAYLDVMARAAKVPDDKRAAAVAEAMKQIAKTYAGTWYGKVAASG